MVYTHNGHAMRVQQGTAALFGARRKHPGKHPGYNTTDQRATPSTDSVQDLGKG